MRLKFDLNVGALYISLTDQPVARTQDIDDNTSVDLDTTGDVVGIEVISVSHPWPLSRILTTYSIPAEEEAQLRAYFLVPSAAAAHMPAPPLPGPPMLSIEETSPVLVAV